MCPQMNPFRRSRINRGDENCLFLNVYTPHTVNDWTEIYKQIIMMIIEWNIVIFSLMKRRQIYLFWCIFTEVDWYVAAADDQTLFQIVFSIMTLYWLHSIIAWAQLAFSAPKTKIAPVILAWKIKWWC